MKLFKYENYQLSLNSEEVLLIPEFKKLMERDRTKNKKKAFAEFTYIYLMLDWNSPFREYSDAEKEKEALRSAEIEAGDVDEFVKAAMEKYDEIKNSNRILTYIKSSWRMLDKLKDYSDTVDLTEVIDSGPQKGKLVHSVRDVRDTIKQMPELIQKAKDLRNLFNEELEEDKNVRGNRTIARDID